MAVSGTKELGKLGKRKSETGNLEDALSSLPSFSSFWRLNEYTTGGEIGGCTAGIGGGEELEVEPQDPLAVFGSGLMVIILCKLDARSVALARLVSAGWLAVGSDDEIWAPKESSTFREIGIVNGDPIQNPSSWEAILY